MAKHQTASCSAEARVGEEGHRLAMSSAHDGAGEPQHLAHAWSTSRAFVTNDHHIPGLDLVMCHCAHGIFLAAEYTCWPSMVEALMTGDFDHASLGREIPFKDDQASVWLDWVGERTHHILASCLY